MAYGTSRKTSQNGSSNLETHLRLENPLKSDRKPVKIGEDSTGLLLADNNVFVEGDTEINGDLTIKVILMF